MAHLEAPLAPIGVDVVRDRRTAGLDSRAQHFLNGLVEAPDARRAEPRNGRQRMDARARKKEPSVERMRREEEAMDAFVVQAVQSLTEGPRVVVEALQSGGAVR